MDDIDSKIRNIDKTICDDIECIKNDVSRKQISQNVLKFLRDLIEHTAIKIYSSIDPNVEVDWIGIKAATKYLKSSSEYLFLKDFHRFLQCCESHYTPSYDGADRLMVKYYEYLVKIKRFYKQRWNMDILGKLADFPIDIDSTLIDYYTKIEKCFSQIPPEYNELGYERYYVLESKPCITQKTIFYQNTLVSVLNNSSKMDRFIAFSMNEIPNAYAIRVSIKDMKIDISGSVMPIQIICEWSTSIRTCEIKNFSKIFGDNVEIKSDQREYIGLMNYINKTGLNLCDLVTLEDDEYKNAKEQILEKAKTTYFYDVLDKSRKIICANEPGSNILRYLLYCCNNTIIKLQYESDSNPYLSGLCLDYGCIPFDVMPFATSLKGHNPSEKDIFRCISCENRKHELFAHEVYVNSSEHGHLYTKIDDLIKYGDVNELIKRFNNAVYRTHEKRKLKIYDDKVYIGGNEEDTIKVVENLQKMCLTGIEGYENKIGNWLDEKKVTIDSPEKESILKTLFSTTKLAMIYGAAGTGKSTLVNYIANLFNTQSKLFLANTHPAVENLKRKVTAPNCAFSTIARYNKSKNVRKEFDILVVDECSTVSNLDMVQILMEVHCQVLVLVGDIYQIESITFGNWFNIARYFVPKVAKHELTIPYRAQNKELLSLWEKVRNIDSDIAEYLVNTNYSQCLDDSVFEKSEMDEIVLCLNYDGIYGINNVNRFLQNGNDNPSYRWGVWTYKVGDPVLFTENERFNGVLFNNLKGKIVNIEKNNDYIEFSIEIEKVLTRLDISGTDLELIKSSSTTSVVKFRTWSDKGGDDDSDNNRYIIPFQIAYAISIHKAQGLEYDSVKVIITQDVNNMITHSIFYTAITRARKKLRIYWTSESQQYVLSHLMKNDLREDANTLCKHEKWKQQKI